MKKIASTLRLALALSLLLALVSLPAAAEESQLSLAELQNLEQLLRQGTVIAREVNVYCQGTFSCASCGAECIRVVLCDPAGSDCECSDEGVTCGDNSKDAPEGKEFVAGSCKITISTSVQQGQLSQTPSEESSE